MMKQNKRFIRTYDELSQLKTFEERFNYLKLEGIVAEETFGHDRWINQRLYKSEEWKRVKNFVITRDGGCDLGCSDHEIHDENILVHHMNPITLEDIVNNSEFVFNPKYLITTIDNTHRAIHYGNKDMLPKGPVERFQNDTCPWKH